MADAVRRGGKKGRKIGRNAAKCKKYSTEKRRIKNKRRKLTKRIKNIKPETQEKILRVNKIGRRKEG